MSEKIKNLNITKEIQSAILNGFADTLENRNVYVISTFDIRKIADEIENTDKNENNVVKLNVVKP